MLCLWKHKWYHISKTLRLCKRCGKFEVQTREGKWQSARRGI